RLLLRSRFARLRAGSRAWRLPFGLCLRLRSWTRGVARFLLRLRRRRGLSRRIGGLLWNPYGAGIPIVVARLRTSQWQTRDHPSPSLHDCQGAERASCPLLPPEVGGCISNRHNGAALA